MIMMNNKTNNDDTTTTATTATKLQSNETDCSFSTLQQQQQQQLKDYKADANKCIEFRFVSNENDLFKKTNDFDYCSEFNPIFTHQIFGEDEEIFGYKNLSIKIYVSSASLNVLLTINYEDKYDNYDKNNELMPYDIPSILSKYVETDYYTTNIDTFTRTLINDNYLFKPYGTLINKYQLTDNLNNLKRFEIYRSTIVDDNDKFKHYYKRLQWFILFFIDAANFIDIDDDKWTYYLVYEKLDNGCYCIVGFLTVYMYYAYFDMKRARISQVLILPPYQRKGHCAKLVQAVYDDLVPNKEILDITVECPSDNFVKVRDYIDTRNTLSLDCFKKLDANDKDYKTILNKFFYKDAYLQMRSCLKLAKKQCRRIFEIICLKYINEKYDDDNYKLFKNEIKKRLKKRYLPLLKAAKGTHSQTIDNLLHNEQKMAKYIRQEAHKLISLYRDVLDRLDDEQNNNFIR